MIAALANTAPAVAQLTTGLVTQQQAQAVGLERAWFSSARVNSANSTIIRCILSGDQLFLLTSAGLAQAIDANTGQTQWVTEVGNANYPSVGPGTNDQFVAICNGTTLYVLDRASGRITHVQKLGGVPGAGPALTKDHAYVPGLMGRMEAFRLVDGVGKTWFYKSYGHIMSSPCTTPMSVVWATDRGNLYIGRADKPGVHFRLEARGEFAAAPAYRAPLIYAVSLPGEVFALDERHGSVRWKYVTGFPTDRAPAVVDDRVYITSDEPMLHAVDAETGAAKWEAPGISQFAAASKTHVFGLDTYGTIHLLNRDTGENVARIPTDGALTALVNDQSDRLYLINAGGLIQCLHEIGAKEPTRWVQPAAPAEDAEKAKEPARPTTPPQERDTSGESSGPGAFPTPETPAPASEKPDETDPFATGSDDPFGT